MINFIKDELIKRKKVYLEDPLIILENYRNEIEKIESYNGRQLLEMLQNADDEAITDKDKTCYIKLTENQLIIANNGKKFSPDGIKSLMYSHLSPKKNLQNKVGQKGLGFRSILSWANSIIVKSYDFAIEFSKENSIEFLKLLIKEKNEIKEILEENEKQEKFPIATLRCPKIIDLIPDDLLDYDTYIMINLKENKAVNVQKQINNEINKEVLLFLNNLEKIIIESPEKSLIIKKEKVSKTRIKIKELECINGKRKFTRKEWNIKTRKGIHKDKNYELKIAWNENLNDKIGRLYSHFKTKVKFPFPALIHGTFELSSDRNELLDDTLGHNVFLIDELIQLLIDTALEISSAEVSYKPLKLLSFDRNESFDTFFDDNEFKEKLKEKIRSNRIFPTRNRKYISYEEEPVFYKNNYSAILPINKFSNLILYSEDKSVIRTLDGVGYFTYKNEDFFNSISEISNQLSLEHRAKLIKYIIDDYGDSEIERKILPNIFIDKNQKVIDSSSEIFLPPSGENINIPLELNLKIINLDLFINLKQILNSNNAEVIEDRLKLFNVKVYRFGEIFRRIISDFNNNPNNKIDRRNSIKKLISHLYELFQSNKSKESIDITIPSNVSIPILNKNNGETRVINVYLGKEYNNNLCEILFEYNKSKLVGSPKIIGLDNKEFVNDFLLWLGVSEYPRKRLVTISEKKYGEFITQNYPFKEKQIYWNDNTITSFEKLTEKGYWINSIKAEIIEDLEDILLNNTNENIIYWLSIDNRILEKNETNSNSEVKIDISRKQSYAYIHFSDMPSYILWRFKQINCIQTLSGKFVKSTQCCISKTITKDFSPFIEIPKINYEHYLFKEEKVSKEAINYFLIKIGVNKEISDFSTDTIYSMLVQLKDIDKDGKKAKLIYLELAVNLDDKKIDNNSAEYKTFIDNGFVFCKKNGNYSYENVKSVYYVEDKTFGEDIINQFHTIEIDRRKGAKKISIFFGVKPLQNLEFTQKYSPTIHNLNEIFQKEIDELKPYFYAFRLAKDTDGKELNWIKNSKITLCTQIQPQYKHNEELRDFELKPYEFIYIEKKNEVYLLVDDGRKYNSIFDFKSDYKFADSIAEIYSSIIKVDMHRSSFRELFKESRMNRSYILETELDDKNLEKLKTSKKKLNVVDDPKIQFWFSIMTSLQEDYEYRKYKDPEFESLILTKLNLNIHSFSLNYNDINDLSNFPVITKLFKILKMDILIFNKNSTIELDITQHYWKQLQQLKNDNQIKFEVILFNSLLNKETHSQKEFLDQQSLYENYNKFPIENSINLQINKLFYNTIKTEFQIELSVDFVVLQMDDIYKKNLKKLEKQIDSLNKTVLYEIIKNDSKLRSLVYFEKYKSIFQEYYSLIEKTDNTKEINFNNKTHKTIKGNLEDLYDLISSNDPITKIEKIMSIKPEEPDGDGGKKRKPKGHSNGSMKSDKETLGCIGEIIVFESLKKKFGNDNVIWDSGFAKKANINPKGNDNKHYDIKYKNKYSKWNYVEVKTTASDKLEFKISNLEVKFGIENKSNYEIMIVINALDEKKNRRIKKLINPFKFTRDESFNDNSKFLVKNDNFIIKLIEK